MKIPYDGKVNMNLIVKRYKDKIFYCVKEFDNWKFSFKPCILAESNFNDIPFVRFFDESMNLNKSFSQSTCWKELFSSFEEAEAEVKRLNSLYFDDFQYKPYMHSEMLFKHKKDLLKIQEDIKKLLSGFENFEGIDFCDVSANGIQIRGHHKQIKGYTYGEQPTIKYDFSNKDDIVMEFVNMWYKYDTPEHIKGELEFIADGEKYGWD